MNKQLILFCVFLLFVSACKDDASKISDLAAECTSGDQEACKKLADIAKNDKEWSVRIAAVEKLTDQKLLADIAINDEDFSAREAAVYRLTDQSVLAKIALEEIAPEDLFLYDIAFKRLKDLASQDVVASDDKDWRVRLILKFIAAFDSVPTEHRERLMMEILPALPNLSYPAVFSVVGDIVSFKTEWNSTGQLYTIGTMKGEIFNCSIKVQKLPEPLSHTWRTSFPFITYSLAFKPAGINAADLLKKPFDKLTDQSVLAEIFKNNRDFYVRRAVLEKLTDQSTLTCIAKNDLDNDVRKAAAKKLTDQTAAQAAFADIARNDGSLSFRLAAVKMITDQALLADIAWSDESLSIHLAAVKMLTNQALLADIARNHWDVEVRKVSVERLTDQKIIAEIVKNDKEWSVRKAAVEKLIDQKLLADIAKNDESSDFCEAAKKRLEELQGK